ncbi:hypothetical protein AAG906_041103 [Vitis piasezkii]
MLDPTLETEPDFDLDIKVDVQVACSKFGIVRYIYVVKNSDELHNFLVQQMNNLGAGRREAEDKLILSNSEAFTLKEKVGSLEKRLKESKFLLMNAKASVDRNQETQPPTVDVKTMLSQLMERLSNCEASSAEVLPEFLQLIRKQQGQDENVAGEEASASPKKIFQFLNQTIEALSADKPWLSYRHDSFPF